MFVNTTSDMNCVWNLRFKSENLAVILGHYYEEVWPFTTTEMLLQMTVCTTWFFRSSCPIAEQIVVEHCHMTSCYLQLLVTTYVPLALHSNASLQEIFSSASKAPQMGLKRHNSVSISLCKMDSFRSGISLTGPCRMLWFRSILPPLFWRNAIGMERLSRAKV